MVPPLPVVRPVAPAPPPVTAVPPVVPLAGLPALGGPTTSAAAAACWRGFVPASTAPPRFIVSPTLPDGHVPPFPPTGRAAFLLMPPPHLCQNRSGGIKPRIAAVAVVTVRYAGCRVGCSTSAHGNGVVVSGSNGDGRLYCIRASRSTPAISASASGATRCFCASTCATAAPTFNGSVENASRASPSAGGVKSVCAGPHDRAVQK